MASGSPEFSTSSERVIGTSVVSRATDGSVVLRASGSFVP
jgi:hypothetical protein